MKNDILELFENPFQMFLDVSAEKERTTMLAGNGYLVSPIGGIFLLFNHQDPNDVLAVNRVKILNWFIGDGSIRNRCEFISDRSWAILLVSLESKQVDLLGIAELAKRDDYQN
jgi:hypothetical protein